MNKAIFIDKDGTLIDDVPYNVDPNLITLAEGAGKSLKLLQDQGFLLAVISNQSGVAHGYFDESSLLEVQQELERQLAEQGVKLNGFFYCPHHPDGTKEAYAVQCSCRKPEPGMLLHAAGELHINLTESWMIGDILHDVATGNQAGCRSILLDIGNETEWDLSGIRTPQFSAKSLEEAAQYILEHQFAHHYEARVA